MKGEILTTDRLILCVPQPEDRDHLIAFRTDINVMRCLGGFGQDFGSGTIQSTDEIIYQLSLAQKYFDDYGLGFFCAFEKESKQFMGQAGLFHVGFNVNQPDIELAYRLHQSFWGKGYATELAQALIHWGFTTRHLDRIIAACHPGNKRSMRVLEKTGMQYDGIVDFRGHHIPGYSITASQWGNKS